MASLDASRTYQLSFTTSDRLAPALSSAVLRFRKTCSVWARTSPLPTTLPSASKATCPATYRVRPAGTSATWLYPRGVERPGGLEKVEVLSLIHISEPTRLLSISYAVF